MEYKDKDLEIYSEELEDETELWEDENEYCDDSEAQSSIKDTLSIYLKEIGKYELLTPEEELKTAMQVESGDSKAREKMITSNLRLVVNVAKKYTLSGIDLMDLIQEGNKGLMRAVEMFDYRKGNKFSTYATLWIKQSIGRYVMDCGKTIRMPVHTLEKYNKIERCRKRLEQELHREPTLEEIANELSLDVDKVISVINMNIDMTSLESPIGSDSEREDSFLIDFIADENVVSPEDQYLSKDLHDVIMNILNSKNTDGKNVFSDREREVILKRFGFYGERYTLRDIGKEMGVTRERVRQIETSAIRKLRRPSLCRQLAAYK